MTRRTLRTRQWKCDAAARHRLRRRRPGRPLFRPADEEGRSAHRVRVVERNRAGDTFGFGVVFSDATMAGIADADADAYRCIAEHLVHWDDIDVHYDGQVLRSTGHGFSGMSRHTLLRVLAGTGRRGGRRAAVRVATWSRSTPFAGADLVVGGDGANSTVRRLAQRPVRDRRSTCGPTASCGSARRSRSPRSRSTSRRTRTGCGACTRTSTSRDARRSSSSAATRPGAPPDSIARARATPPRFSRRCSRRSSTGITSSPTGASGASSRPFATAPWSAGHVVLIGDAAHTAHFSVGSGTRMAMEDAVALRARDASS